MTAIRKAVLGMAAAAAGAMAAQGAGQAQPFDYDPTVSVVSKLGIESTFQVSETTVDDELAYEAYPFSSGFLAVSPTEHVIVMVPFWSLQGATLLHDDRLQLALTNGSLIEGWGVGQIFGSGQQSLSVNSLQHLSVVEVPDDFKDMVSRYFDSQSESQLWRLTAQAPGGETSYLIRDPRFAFQYYSSEGYIMGGSDHVQSDETQFWIEIDGSSLGASLTSFERVAISPSTEDYGLPALSLRAPNGTVSTGKFILKAEDSEGEHESDGRWAVYGSLEGQTDVVVLIRGSLVDSGGLVGSGGGIVLERVEAP